MNASKYKPFPGAELKSRTWPDKRIEKAPIWCSVDLRDGNQALIDPMGIETKLKFFDLLVKIGFKEIEICFPSASDTEFDFCRRLIDEKHIPDDVTIQVLCQAREHLIKKTMEAIKGAPNVIFHIYNSTSPAQRKYVFNKSKEEIIKIAVDGVKCIKECMKDLSEDERKRIRLEYSPESFSMTEIDYAIEICNAVGKEWGFSAENKIIYNLPSTVECYTPNVYADSIEYFASKVENRENVIISTHCHNDRGTGVAACELGLLAGADRVEGCLFGNGERTGNVDIVTVAMNMFSHGIDPGLDFSDMPHVCAVYERNTGMEVEPRRPYCGALVFAAFSGSHQDAIAKGMNWIDEVAPGTWTVPYLPINPRDVGRNYDADVIRINSQSGKGGVSYILERDYGLHIPKEMREAVGYAVKAVSDRRVKELSSEEIFEVFKEKFENINEPYKLLEMHFKQENGITAEVTSSYMGEVKVTTAAGNGRLNAVSNAIRKAYGLNYHLVSYEEHSLDRSSSSRAIAYVGIETEDEKTCWGAGIDVDIIKASVDALMTAVNQSAVK